VNIRTRATLLGMLPALLIATLLGSYLSASRLGDLEASLHARGAALARQLAQGAQYGVVSGNLSAVRAQLRRMQGEADVVFLGVFDPDGTVLAELGRPPAGVPGTLRAGESDDGHFITITLPVELPRLEADDPAVNDPLLATDAGAASWPVGWARVVVSRAGHEKAARQMLFAGLGLTLVGLAFAWLLVRQLAVSGIRPLMQTIGTVRDIASGNLDARLPVTATSELRILQQDINDMAAALRVLRQDMRGQVEAATAQLAAQKEAAERADQAKSRFLAAASHDLRQPMHALGLFVEAMKPQLEGRRAANLLDKIEASVITLEGLFNAILDISRLDAGAVVPQPRRVEVEPILTRLGHEFEAEAEARGLELRTRCARGLICETDPVLLERILRNLLSNALRYTQAGGVLLSARRFGARARIQVWDTGTGITAQDQARVFEEFYQLDNPHRDRERGLGLGLAIVKRLAELLGCPLSLRSIPGRGSVFSLDVRLSRKVAAAADTVQSAPAGLGRLKGRLLVVEDDAVGRDALATLLRDWGLIVDTAAGSAEALAHLRQAPEVLLSDFRLSGETGLDVVRALRQAFPDQPMAAVLITADTADDTVRAIREQGLHLLHKPLRPARLRALLTQLLRPPGGEAGDTQGKDSPL
jgi:signal transduction histidine kinase/CheY-like chemotaxis protein